MTLTIPDEGTYDDLELAWIESEPPGIFPTDQDSLWGSQRRVFTDYLQTNLFDRLYAYWLNMAPETCDEDDLVLWEFEYGIPSDPNRTIEQRRAQVLARMQKGAFTRTRRRTIVESYILATEGTPITFITGGMPFPDDGMIFASGVFDPSDVYAIYEDIPNFSYTVRIRNSVDFDLDGLIRELQRMTPSPIDANFTVEQVVDPAMEDGGTLTTSGNEIDDLVRANALAWLTTQSGGSVDEFQNDSSLAVWRAATNLFSRGQCATTSGYVSSSSGSPSSFATDATEPPPFSTQSVKVTTVGDASNQGAVLQTATGLAAAAGIRGVGSVYFKGVTGQSYTVFMRWYYTDATTLDGASTVFTATGSWQMLTPASLVVAAGKTGDRLGLSVKTASARAESFWVAHGMMESNAMAVSPYVATNSGATATRAAARVRIPSTYMDESQFWFAASFVYGFPSTLLSSNKYLLDWRDDANNLLGLYLDSVTKKWNVQRLVAGSGAAAVSAAQSFAIGDQHVVIAAFEPGQVKVRVGSSSFVAAANTSIPTLAASLTDLFTQAGSSGHINSRVKWAACGVGLVSDADADIITSFTSDPYGVDFPEPVELTAIMRMDDETILVPFGG